MNYAKTLLKWLLQTLVLHYCLALDTLTFNESIKDEGGTILVSNGGNFSVGFFSPGKSSSRYLGVWFNFSKETVIWIANRDSPINNTSGVLSFDQHGNLVLFSSQHNLSLWSSNVSVSSIENVEARILDSGSFVIVREDKIVWESFDNPSHALLSGMKVGLDFRKGINRVVRSWKSPDDPGTGNCSLRMETKGSPQLILYKERAKWWRAGHWNGLQWGGIPALSALPRANLFNINFINNQNEVTVAWTVIDPTVLTYIIIDESGFLRQFAWQGQESHRWVEIYTAPGDNCDQYARCGSYGKCDPYNTNGEYCACLPGYDPVSPHDWALRDGSRGCKRREGAPSMCRNGEGFVKIENVKVPDVSGAVVDRSLGLKECREECLRNCSCLAYGAADVRNGGSGCLSWYGNLVDIKQFIKGGQVLYVRVDSIELANYENSDGISTKWIVAIVGLAIAAALLLVASVLWWLKRRKRIGRFVLRQQATLYTDVSASSTAFEDSPNKTGGEKTDHVRFFDLSTIVAATDNFSSCNKLGQGGFGSVYKGVLADGKELAVKRLSQFSGQGVEEFKNEVVLIAKLQHKNLVKLLGCCINREEKMLIYEYMPNKSLDFLLFDKNKKSLLDWRKRSQIIFGIARGLLYLHEDSRLKIIHRDLKASNVLLDAIMNPKISDFGMARMFGDDQIEANTNKVVGTYGYMSPEYAMEGLYSIKSDVFSFGVLTLEIITGKKNSNFNEVSSLNLVGQVWDLWTEGKALDIVDESLGQSYPSNQVLRWIQIGLLCVQEVAADRPPMLEIIFMLGNENPLPFPKRPAFIYKNAGSDTSTSRGVSVNNITVTVLEAR